MLTDDQIIAHAASVVEQAFIGAVSTVDEAGRPHSRYMAAVADSPALEHLYSVTATETRKVEHARRNAAVCWLFHSTDYQRVATLHGDAALINTSDLPMSAWHSLSDYAQLYTGQALREAEHYAFYAMVTRVHSVELLAPDLELRTPRVVTIGH